MKKMCLPLCAALLLLMPAAASAGESVLIGKIDFSSVKPTGKITVLEDENDAAKKMLRLRSAVQFEVKLPGNGWRKIAVAFRARLGGENTIENNPLYLIAPAMANLPLYTARQADSQKRTNVFMRNPQFFRAFLLSSKWMEYSRVFYAEPNAESLQIVLAPESAGELFLGEITVSEIHDGRIEANGDFALGPYNYSGIAGFERSAIMEKGKDGRGQLNTSAGGAAYTEVFPLKPNTKYRLSVEWNNYRKDQMRVHNYFKDENGKTVQNYAWMCRKPPAKRRNPKLPPVPESERYVSSNEFVTNGKIACAYIYFYEGIISGYKIEEIVQ